MTLLGIDISNHQGATGFDLEAVMNANPNIDFYICKATEGITFIDVYCFGWVNKLINAGKLCGFYHFARGNQAESEAAFFVENFKDFFGKAVPVLDWEVDEVSIDWVNRWCDYVHSATGIWPWVYANPWRFGNGGVNPECERWIAAYQSEMPSCDQNPICWQFTSDGTALAYNGRLDFNYFYGTREDFMTYANPAGQSQPWTDVVQWTVNHSSGQKWHTVGTGRTVEIDGKKYDTYELINDATGWALDLTNGIAEDGTNVGNYIRNGSDAQAWAFVPVNPTFAGSSNRYEIRSAVDPDYAMAVWDGSTVEGADVLLWSANGQPGQVWELVYIGGDAYEIVCTNSGMALAAVTNS